MIMSGSFFFYCSCKKYSLSLCTWESFDHRAHPLTARPQADPESGSGLKEEDRRVSQRFINKVVVQYLEKLYVQLASWLKRINKQRDHTQTPNWFDLVDETSSNQWFCLMSSSSNQHCPPPNNFFFLSSVLNIKCRWSSCLWCLWSPQTRTRTRTCPPQSTVAFCSTLTLYWLQQLTSSRCRLWFIVVYFRIFSTAWRKRVVYFTLLQRSIVRSFNSAIQTANVCNLIT